MAKSKKKNQNKQYIVKTIIQAAAVYKKEMVGRHFMYVFEDRYIEVVYRTKDFMHLTGVEYNSSAEQFYKDAINKKLKPSQISFSPRHPYDLCIKKISQLINISRVVDSEIFLLVNTITNTFTYKFGLTDLTITVCLSEDKDKNGNVVGDHYIARSFRVGDNFNKSSDVFDVKYIFSRDNGTRKYNTISYADEKSDVASLPQYILDKLDENIK